MLTTNVTACPNPLILSLEMRLRPGAYDPGTKGRFELCRLNQEEFHPGSIGGVMRLCLFLLNNSKILHQLEIYDEASISA